MRRGRRVWERNNIILLLLCKMSIHNTYIKCKSLKNKSSLITRFVMHALSATVRPEPSKQKSFDKYIYILLLVSVLLDGPKTIRLHYYYIINEKVWLYDNGYFAQRILWKRIWDKPTLKKKLYFIVWYKYMFWLKDL